jgi:hypothetical protein
MLLGARNESESRRATIHPFAFHGNICLAIVRLYVLGERWDAPNEGSRCLLHTLYFGNHLLHVLA